MYRSFAALRMTHSTFRFPVILSTAKDLPLEHSDGNAILNAAKDLPHEHNGGNVILSAAKDLPPGQQSHRIAR